MAIVNNSANSNVILLDPNDVNTNPNMVNSIPQYQDMFIYAELRAVRKERTVLVTSSEKGNGSNVLKTGLEKNVGEVNFIGVDQNKNSPDYLKFTTRYYDGSNGDNIQYEGFGMSNIKVIINSSFIPQVSIQFIDVRGLAFFNRTNSPYRILFDFPPPIFYFTIKGYYGKALNYKLHLVKYTSEFKAENGNFVIDAQFVAVTFAPLTDVLFRYVVNFPLIASGNTSSSLVPKIDTPPRNTFELILKLKVLYDDIDKKIKSLNETKNYDLALNQIAKNTLTLSILANYKDKLSINGNSYLLLVDSSKPSASSASAAASSSLLDNINMFDSKVQSNPINGNEVITSISFSDYDEIIKMASTPAKPTNINKKLYVVYITGKKDTIPYSTTTAEIDKNFDSILGGYKNELINSYNDIKLSNDSSNGSINIPLVNFTNSYDVSTFINSEQDTKYRGIDITNIYISLYKNQSSLNQSKAILATQINTIINQTIMKNLGMMPTIYNIFKIILDDVDTFFRTLTATSISAENHHNTLEYNKLIISDNRYADIKTTNKKIYSFPLVIDKQSVAGGSGNKEIRVAPVKLSQLLTQPFPELTLIQNFIDTFNRQSKFNEIMNQKDLLNDDGTYKWIPISPLDSKLGSDEKESAYIGPFYGVDTNDGGTGMPINLSSDVRLSQILKIVLDRFYIISQSSYPTSFYSTQKGVSKAYIELYAKAEAVNLANSANQTTYVKNLIDSATLFNNLTNFYNYLNDPKKGVLDHYIFNNTDKTNIPLANEELNSITAYVNKKNPAYVGSVIRQQNIKTQTFDATSTSTKPVDKFQNTKLRGFIGNIFLAKPAKDFYLFTKENLIYIMDGLVEKNAVVTNNTILDKQEINMNTRYLDSTIFGTIPLETKNNIIPKLLLNGNAFYSKTNTKNAASNLRSFDNIINSWISQLSHYDDQIYDTIIDANNPSYNRNLSELIFLSNFGFTLSPFNQYPNKLNSLIFNIAGVIQVPTFLPAYIGLLVLALRNNGDPNSTFNVKTIQDFFTTGGGRNLESSGFLIFADLHDVDKYLSQQDKENYFDEFDVFDRGQYISILAEVYKMYHTIKDDVTDKHITKPAEIITEKQLQYDYYLNPNSKIDDGNNVGSKYIDILSPLITRTNILNFSEITFSTDDSLVNIAPNIGYTSLQALNADTAHPNKKTANDSFFKIFFSELLGNLQGKQKELKDQDTENLKLSGDEDIITQTYYSFKNINDKWLTNPDINSKNGKGYPLNDNNAGKGLIDSFVFVDRAMNPIGDTILNVEILSQMFDDPNISVFSVLSQILSLNGFEFFPLQNFMSYTQQSWIDSFKIAPNINSIQNVAYVCMYIGGTSSYPTGVANGFMDDGITDLANVGVIDFNTKPPIDKDGNLIKEISLNSEDGKQVSNNKKFPWAQVRAFRVRFGEQNQSMFTDIKIDSKEYPETNESIQILARLAGDDKVQSPIPKGQNLFSLYENRAYKATITGLGNAMIQPTQYFQLENVPLFSGAYIILTVEHNIEGNRMMTSFSGTKILRYPIPRVLNPAAIMGFEGGDSDSTSPTNMSAGDITKGFEAVTISQKRLDELNSVFGIDVSYAQGQFSWTKAVSNTNTDYRIPKFAIIKVSQGTGHVDEQGRLNSIGAKAAGLKIGYYHYAQQFVEGSNDEAISDATAQATHFVNVVQSLPNKPDFPLMLDMEDQDDDKKNIHIHWSSSKPINDLWINTFLSVLKSKGYNNTILYGNNGFYTLKTTNNFGSQPLWHAAYPTAPKNSPEWDAPIIASGWNKNGWKIWQFTSSNNKQDLNVMKTDFFNNPPSIT